MKIAMILRTSSAAQVDPRSLDALGATEALPVRLALEWAKCGHEVHVLAPNREAVYHTYAGGGSATFASDQYAVPLVGAFHYDVIIAWNDGNLLELPGIHDDTIKIGASTHVDPSGALEAAHGWVVLSDWAKGYVEKLLPEDIPVFTVPIATHHIGLHQDMDVIGKKGVAKSKKDQVHFLYASSPDRGLHHLLNMWPNILREYPRALLTVTYGAREWAEQARWSHNEQGEIALQVLKGLTQRSVYNAGRISQAQLFDLHQRSDALLYPYDPIQPSETGCATVLEALVAGSLPVITNGDCLGHEYGKYAVVTSLPLNYDHYLERLQVAISSDTRALRAKGIQFARTRTWERSASEWLQVIVALKSRLPVPA